ncbi:MAG: hypothetical protein ACHREM_01400 [Polyangiales bacterium]
MAVDAASAAAPRWRHWVLPIAWFVGAIGFFSMSKYNFGPQDFFFLAGYLLLMGYSGYSLGRASKA